MNRLILAYRKFLAVQERTALRRKTLTTLMQKGKGKQFGVLSAYGKVSKKKNQARNGDLYAALQQRGYHKISPVKGSWEGVAEKSVLVPNLKFDDVIDLGRHFQQDSVIWKSPDGVVGMYYLKEQPKANIAVDPETSKAAVQVSTDSDLYSKLRGLSFEFGFLWGQDVPWDGRTPITAKQVRKLINEGKLTAA